MSIERLRAIFGVVEARVLIEPRWRGAEVDRLLDADHASIVEAVARRLEARGWQVAVEVTYAIGSERGSVDVFGLDPARRASLVVEVKSDIAAAEAVGRKLDEKRRLAAIIVQSRFGWTPSEVGVVLVLPESPRLRRLLAGPASALARMFPIDGPAVARWLRTPAGSLAATWFLSDISPRAARRIRREVRPTAKVRGPAQVPSLNVDPRDHEPPTRILR